MKDDVACEDAIHDITPRFGLNAETRSTRGRHGGGAGALPGNVW